MPPVLRIIILGAVLAFAAGQLNAQQAQQLDRKDRLMQALESQRNDALAKLAFCAADANAQIEALTAQLADANKKLAEAEKKAAPETDQK